MKKTPSETIITEQGFRRIIYRKGKQKTQKTETHKKNPLKVTLAKIGDLEIYVYPFQYPDKIFLGKYPQFTMILSKYDLGKWFASYNIMKWFLNGYWTKKAQKRKRSQKTSATIQKAYNLGIQNLKEAQK